MARYVVLRHSFPPSDARQTHYDLMLEHAGVLLTWSLDHWPSSTGALARRLPDHRLHYLEYEGPISGNRGEVERVECGDLSDLVVAPALVRAKLGDRTEITLRRNAGTPEMWQIDHGRLSRESRET
jgi:hypothetical protein